MHVVCLPFKPLRLNDDSMLTYLEQNMVLLERLDLNALRLEDQTGYFVPTSTPIHVYLITGFKEVEGPLRTSNIDLDSAILSTAIRTKKIQ